MTRAVTSVLSRSVFTRLLGVSAVLIVSGCVGNSAFDDLDAMQPTGSSFSIALFKNYSHLAKSFGTQSEPSGQAFDSAGTISLTGTDNTVSGLADAYARKALAAGRGDEVLPETAPDGDTDAENARIELLGELDEGRDKVPEDAARAQAAYDCWIMNKRVDTLAAASQSCRSAAVGALARLKHELNQPAPASAPEATDQGPSAAPQPASEGAAQSPSVAPQASPEATARSTSTVPQSAQFTVYFDFRSAALSAEQLAMISQTIAAARTGRQTHITVVGHTDAAENSRTLSLRRANAVEAALVRLGARPDAITVSGVGKDDPAVQTGDTGKEPKNRRVVISLIP